MEQNRVVYFQSETTPHRYRLCSASKLGAQTIRRPQPHVHLNRQRDLHLQNHHTVEEVSQRVKKRPKLSCCFSTSNFL